MQIHELNNFSGTLGSGAYLAVDDGNDTGKLSTQQLLAATEARIDNIIAGPAPSAEEIVDARLGADGVTYPSLGDAIRDQFTDLKSELSNITGGERIAVTTGYYINTSGSTVDIDNPTQSSGFSYAIEDCTEGDAFTINGTGGSGPRLWCFIDSSGNALTKSNASETLQNGTIIAPANASKLVINFSGNGSFALKGYALNNAVSKGVELFGQFAFGRPIFEKGSLSNKAGVLVKGEHNQRARSFSPIPVNGITSIAFPTDYTAYLFTLDVYGRAYGNYILGSYFDITALDENCAYVAFNIYHTSGSSVDITDSDIEALNDGTVVTTNDTEVLYDVSFLKDMAKQSVSAKILFESGTYANLSGTLEKASNSARGRSISIIERKNISRITVPSIYTAILFKQDINQNVISYEEGNDFDLTSAETSCVFVSLVARHKWDSTLEITSEDIATLTNDTLVQYTEGSSPIGEIEVVHFVTSPVFNNTVYTDRGILVLPSNYSPSGTPTRLCIVCHGAGATKYEEKTMDSTGKILGDPQRVLTKMGFAVMDCFAAPYDLVANLGDHLGNPTVQACYNAAYDYVIENYNLKDDGILLTGSSMGGLSMFGILTNNHIPVIAAVGYCPCVDLYKQAYCNPWSSSGRSQLATLYDFEGTTPTFTASYPPTDAEKAYFLSNIDKVIGYYPMLYNEFVGDFDEIYSILPSSKYASDVSEANVYNAFKKFVKAPLLVVHCDDDQVMSSRYSKYIINQLKATGQLCDIKIYDSGGHGAWEAGSTVTKTDVDGNSFTCKESQWIGYTWLKNFD